MMVFEAFAGGRPYDENVLKANLTRKNPEQVDIINVNHFLS